MTHAFIPDFSQPAPVRFASAAPVRPSAVSMMAAAESAFARHVAARQAVRANPTPARIHVASACWNDVLAAADTIVSAPIPRTVEALRCLAVGISMSMEQGLDRDDDVHEALRALLAGVMMVVDAVPPEGHEGL